MITESILLHIHCRHTELQSLHTDILDSFRTILLRFLEEKILIFVKKWVILYASESSDNY